MRLRMWWDFNQEVPPRELMKQVQDDEENLIALYLKRSREALQGQGIKTPDPETKAGRESWVWAFEVDTQMVPHPQAPNVMVPVTRSRICIEVDAEVGEAPPASKLILPDKIGGILRR